MFTVFFSSFTNKEADVKTLPFPKNGEIFIRNHTDFFRVLYVYQTTVSFWKIPILRDLLNFICQLAVADKWVIDHTNTWKSIDNISLMDFLQSSVCTSKAQLNIYIQNIFMQPGI